MKPIIAALLALPMATAAVAQDTGPLEVDVVGGIQAPMAIVIFCGLLTSTALTLLVLPALYRWFERERPEVEL